MVASLVLTAFDDLPEIGAGVDLVDVIVAAAKRAGIAWREGDLVAVAQKVVSKAEGRKVRLADVRPSMRAQELAKESDKDPRVVELILQESTEVLRCRPGVIIVVHRLGFVLANAGIDASNVETSDGDESVLLLPPDPDASAASIRAGIRRAAQADIGVIVNDSFGRAWRLGTIGTAIGVAGMSGLLDLRGTFDRAGRALRVTELGVADEVAAAASLMMGQAAEGRPVVHIRGFPYKRREGCAAELVRSKQMDMFR
jgi:coenzyme F420-0:L-glutamate ligase / coenzyme F420-1:gamma-L-glutamate ligase